MEAKQILDIIKRRIPATFIFVAIGIIVAFFYIRTLPLTYTASFSVTIGQNLTSDAKSIPSQLTESFSGTILGWFKTREFIRLVLIKKGIKPNDVQSKDVESLVNKFTVTKLSTSFIQIKIDQKTAEDAQALSTATIEVLKNETKKFNSLSSIIDYSVAFSTPNILQVKPRSSFILLLIGAVLAVIAFFVIFILEFFSPFVYRKDEIEQIFTGKHIYYLRIAGAPLINETYFEEYRFLRNEFLQKYVNDHFIVIAGLSRSVGDSVAAHIGAVLGAGGTSTLICDIVAGSEVSQYIGAVKSDRGLSDFLKDLIHPGLYTQDTRFGKVSYMGMGTSEVDSDILVQSNIDEMISVFSKRSDITIFNAPPLLTNAATSYIFKRLKSPLIMVIKLSKITRDQLKLAKQMLEDLKIRYEIVVV